MLNILSANKVFSVGYCRAWISWLCWGRTKVIRLLCLCHCYSRAEFTFHLYQGDRQLCFISDLQPLQLIHREVTCEPLTTTATFWLMCARCQLLACYSLCTCWSCHAPCLKCFRWKCTTCFRFCFGTSWRGDKVSGDTAIGTENAGIFTHCCSFSGNGLKKEKNDQWSAVPLRKKVSLGASGPGWNNVAWFSEF